MHPDTTTVNELEAIGKAISRAVEEAVPASWSDALEVDLRRDWIRLTADVFKLKRHNYELFCRARTIELRTPKKRFRFALKSLTPESAFAGGNLIITLRNPAATTAEPGVQGELGRATWRVVNAATGGKRVFVTRAVNAVADLAERSPEHSLDVATAAPSDWEVLLRALSSPDVAEPVSVADPLAGARLRGIHARRKLLQAEGGTIPAPEVANILGISRQAIDKRRQAGTLLGVTVGSHGYRYPVWQFEEHGILPGLDRVLKALARHDDWMKLAFFVNANDRLRGQRPLERLRRGELQPVLDAAESYGEHGAA